MKSSSSPPNLAPELVRRLRALEREVGDLQLGELCAAWEQWEEEQQAPEWEGALLDVERFRDAVSTRLMEAFRTTGSSAAFGLLYELNHRIFASAISARLRKFYFALDPQDVLQEVFFNIYRYPHKFQADREKAFRYWASMIVRNTVYKSTRDRDRELTHEQQDEEIDARPDEGGHSNPLGRAILEESQRFCDGAYVLYLSLYLAAYQQLSARERRALHMVEVDGLPYKETAVALRIRLENLKMVIFRARKKILRALDRAMSSADSWRPDMVAGQRGSCSGAERRNAASGAEREGAREPRGRVGEDRTGLARTRRIELQRDARRLRDGGAADSLGPGSARCPTSRSPTSRSPTSGSKKPAARAVLPERAGRRDGAEPLREAEAPRPSSVREPGGARRGDDGSATSR